MASKYAKLNLPPLEEQDVRHRSLVEKEASKITATKPAELAKMYLKIREKKEVKADELKSIQVILDAIIHKLKTAYEEEGITQIKLEGGATVSTQPEPVSQVTNKDEIREWAIAQGLERELSLPWSTLNSIVKQLLVSGKPEPPGVKAFMRTKIVRRGTLDG